MGIYRPKFIVLRMGSLISGDKLVTRSKNMQVLVRLAHCTIIVQLLGKVECRICLPRIQMREGDTTGDFKPEFRPCGVLVHYIARGPFARNNSLVLFIFALIYTDAIVFGSAVDEMPCYSLWHFSRALHTHATHLTSLPGSAKKITIHDDCSCPIRCEKL